MIFHPIRLALVAVVCMVCGVGGSSAHSGGDPVPHPSGHSALVSCLETAAGDPQAVQSCASRERLRLRLQLR
jgi:hypothetical protein